MKLRDFVLNYLSHTTGRVNDSEVPQVVAPKEEAVIDTPKRKCPSSPTEEKCSACQFAPSVTRLSPQGPNKS